MEKMESINNLEEHSTKQKDVNQKFISKNKHLDFDVSNFWQWALSDLIENRNRGILAEYIVKQALKIKQNTRLEWEAYDLKTKNGIKIEIKSSAYFQAWKQKRKSNITFGIAPTKTLLNNNNYSKEKKRHSDIYIFCLFDVSNENTKLEPLNLDQWTFFLVKKMTLDIKDKNQGSISLSSLKTLEHICCKYEDLEKEFKRITKSIF